MGQQGGKRRANEPADQRKRRRGFVWDVWIQQPAYMFSYRAYFVHVTPSYADIKHFLPSSSTTTPPSSLFTWIHLSRFWFILPALTTVYPPLSLNHVFLVCRVCFGYNWGSRFEVNKPRFRSYILNVALWKQIPKQTYRGRSFHAIEMLQSDIGGGIYSTSVFVSLFVFVWRHLRYFLC